MSGRFLGQYFQINNINRDLLIKFLLCLPGIGKLYRFQSLIGRRASAGFGFQFFLETHVKAFCYKSAKTTIRCQAVLTAFLAFARYRSDLFFGFGHFNGRS